MPHKEGFWRVTSVANRLGEAARVELPLARDQLHIETRYSSQSSHVHHGTCRSTLPTELPPSTVNFGLMRDDSCGHCCYCQHTCVVSVRQRPCTKTCQNHVHSKTRTASSKNSPKRKKDPLLNRTRSNAKKPRQIRNVGAAKVAAAVASFPEEGCAVRRREQ